MPCPVSQDNIFTIWNCYNQNSNKTGKNMECGCCFSEGNHIHVINDIEFKEIKDHIDDKTTVKKDAKSDLVIMIHLNHGSKDPCKKMCPICKHFNYKTHYKVHYHLYDIPDNTGDILALINGDTVNEECSSKKINCMMMK